MKITDEEIEICRLLPEYELEVGDRCYIKSNITNKETIVLIDEDDLEDVRNISKKEGIIVWIPLVEQLMSLEEWPETWTLGYGKISKSWGIVEAKMGKVKVVVGYGCETARLACLRALKPILEGK